MGRGRYGRGGSGFPQLLIIVCSNNTTITSYPYLLIYLVFMLKSFIWKKKMIKAFQICVELTNTQTECKFIRWSNLGNIFWLVFSQANLFVLQQLNELLLKIQCYRGIFFVSLFFDVFSVDFISTLHYLFCKAFLVN